jgi:hypothetical protein
MEGGIDGISPISSPYEIIIGWNLDYREMEHVHMLLSKLVKNLFVYLLTIGKHNTKECILDIKG